MTHEEAVGSPFSGGAGKPGTGVQAPVPTSLSDLFNARLKNKYLIDPEGAKIEMTFDFATTTVTIKAGDTIMSYPFIKR